MIVKERLMLCNNKIAGHQFFNLMSVQGVFNTDVTSISSLGTELAILIMVITQTFAVYLIELFVMFELFGSEKAKKVLEKQVCKEEKLGPKSEKYKKFGTKHYCVWTTYLM